MKLATPLSIAQSQRSHTLFVLSNPVPGKQEPFLAWYGGSYLRAIFEDRLVLAAKHFEQHEVDITLGRHPRLPYRHLAIYELALDGAEQADGLCRKIAAMHEEEESAETPALWLYYPICERVGREPSKRSLLTIAFANGLANRQTEFEEWYTTRHIRHALKIPALTSGQCFRPTGFQHAGPFPISFDVIAVYDQEGEPESIIESFELLPPEALSFPTLDVHRFAESVYRAI